MFAQGDVLPAGFLVGLWAAGEPIGPKDLNHNYKHSDREREKLLRYSTFSTEPTKAPV